MTQTNNMHMHLEHNGHADTLAHFADIHPESTLHESALTSHGNGFQNDHSAIAVDVSSDKLINKVNLLDPMVLIFFFIGLFLYTPNLKIVHRRRLNKIFFIPGYYLIKPPLRAPPIK